MARKGKTLYDIHDVHARAFKGETDVVRRQMREGKLDTQTLKHKLKQKAKRKGKGGKKGY